MQCPHQVHHLAFGVDGERKFTTVRGMHYGGKELMFVEVTLGRCLAATLRLQRRLSLTLSVQRLKVLRNGLHDEETLYNDA